MPRILITNDDGIQSPGLRAAAEAVHDLAELVIVAPRRQQSATGRSLVGHPDERLCRVPFEIDGHPIEAYDTDCSPALATQHGLQTVCHGRLPDLVLSGINYGENLGWNVTISGTVGAALHGASFGVPALAVSVETDHAYHFEYGAIDWRAAQHFARRFAQKLLTHGLPDECHMLNVNVPDNATPSTDWCLTRLAPHEYFSAILNDPHPEARIGDTDFGVYLEDRHLVPGTDVHAIVKQRVVSVTPLTMDLTAPVDRDTFRRSFD